jgi:hypothetical protein
MGSASASSTLRRDKQVEVLIDAVCAMDFTPRGRLSIAVVPVVSFL